MTHAPLRPSPYEHIIESQQFDEDYLRRLFALATRMKHGSVERSLTGRIIATLFYEPSTRTRLSFEAAALRLGAQIISTENAREFSSAAKGESIEDTIRVLCAYADAIVMRHYENDACERALRVATRPIINAGSGSAQHPTQALLDLFTIYEHHNTLENLHIALVGDLLRGRTVNSLVYLLSKFSGNTFTFISPENCTVKQGVKDHLAEHAIAYTESYDLNTALEKADVLYVTRIQKERFDDPREYEQARGKFILTKEKADKMLTKSIIMHPLPRVDEIEADVDENPRARYFEQAENGLYVRMALLQLILQSS